ncbi:MAG: hypothetical protein CMJ05_08310 [Pelagibacterales bacterium]|nr:hypothetical protein [Pelagibacterales bacterium]|tara:strand:+ start:297 stop:521 length:225 start_codon:yes stop_codon:yes gene_type:complete
MPSELFYLLSVTLLALLLYYPVNKLIFILSVRRYEKKIGNSLSDEELRGQLIRSRFITIILIIFFSSLFNLNHY